MSLENNDRMEEWGLVIGDWYRATNRIWFYLLGLVILLAIPAQIVLKLVFREVLVAANQPIRVNYQEVVKKPLEIIERKIFDLGDGTYSGYARIKNPNPDWGVPNQKYSYVFKSASGETLLSASGETFVLPDKDKFLAFPRFQAASKPTTLDLAIAESTFIRPPTLPTLNLVIERRSVDHQINQTIVNAVIVNDTPFQITRVDLPVLLFNSAQQVVGAGYTNINDLSSSESRSFQYTWHSRINNISRIEISPEINPYNRNIFGTVPGQNPF
jgi:hypothetical protein